MNISGIYTHIKIPQAEEIKQRNISAKQEIKNDTFTPRTDNAKKAREARNLLDENIKSTGFDNPKKVKMYEMENVIKKLKQYPLHSVEIPREVLYEILTMNLIKQTNPNNIERNIETLAENVSPNDINKYFSCDARKYPIRCDLFQAYMTDDSDFFKDSGIEMFKRTVENGDSALI